LRRSLLPIAEPRECSERAQRYQMVATIRLIYGNWEDAKVVQPGEVLELARADEVIE